MSLALLSPGSAFAESSTCPNERTCAHYSFTFGAPVGWPVRAHEPTKIPYYVNPDGQTTFSGNDFAIAVQRAAETWMAWNPRIKFVFMGVTHTPAVPADGVNVIGWTIEASSSANARSEGQHLVEFDITFSTGPLWGSHPCRQANDSCTEVAWHGPGGIYMPSGTPDLQNVATHELGHALGLFDTPDGPYCLLTMNGGVRAGAATPHPGCERMTNRSQNTLALGDVLGLKVLYPWTCPKLRRGQRYTGAYRNLCPRITIYVP